MIEQVGFMNGGLLCGFCMQTMLNSHVCNMYAYKTNHVSTHMYIICMLTRLIMSIWVSTHKYSVY